MEFRLLGPLEVADEGALVELGAPKMRSLLTALLLRPNVMVPAERLVDDLWGEAPPSTAAATLQTYIARLRRVVDPGPGTGEQQRIMSRRPGYLIRVGADELDVARFEALAAEGHRALSVRQWELAAETLRRALSLWRGPALGELAFEPFAQAEAVRLEEGRVCALEARVAADLALGGHGELIGELEGLVGQHPLREKLRGQLMVALYRSGRQAEALRSYQAFRRLLGEELGIEPSLELRRLEEALLVQSVEVEWPGAPAVASPAGQAAQDPPTTGNRPSPAFAVPLTTYLAPEHVRKVQELLAATRLVTLTGTGGIGKTRLGLEVAAAALDDQFDGVTVVELAPVVDPDLVPHQVLTSLGGREAEGHGVRRALVDHLATRRLLLVLDNCEHVIDACAELAAHLLASCPELHVLATSRERLRLPGESVWRVPALSAPPAELSPPVDELAGYDSVRLFLDRALSVGSAFELTEQNAPAVAEICRRLDGIPLALELAAARTSVLSVQEIASRLTDRFRLLATGPRTAPVRHRTLRAAVDWTYEALSETERRVFDRTSVFAGGFDLQAVERVAAGDGVDETEVFEALAGLVEKSLVLHEEQAGRSRFGLLETLRQYGTEKLAAAGEETVVRERHMEWALSLAEGADGGAPGQEARTEPLALDIDNFRAALAWGVSKGGGTGALRLAVALSAFWQRRDLHSEGRTCLETALTSAPEAPADLRAQALHKAAGFALAQADYHGAGSLAQQSLALHEETGNLKGTAQALRRLGTLAWRQDRYEEAGALSQASLDIARRLGDKEEMAASLDGLSTAAQGQGAFETARRLEEDALDLYRELDDHPRIAFSLLALAQLISRTGDYVAADDRCRESEAIARRLGTTALVAGTLMVRGETALLGGNHAPARRMLVEALAMSETAGERHNAGWSRQFLADVATAEGDLGPARRGYEEVLALAGELNDRYMAAWSLRGLSRVAWADGDQAGAAALCRRAVLTAQEIGDLPGVATALEIVAGMAAQRYEGVPAARLLGAAETLRLATSNPVPRCDRGEHEETIAQARAAVGPRGFARAWADGRGLGSDEYTALVMELTGERRADLGVHHAATGSGHPA